MQLKFKLVIIGVILTALILSGCAQQPDLSEVKKCNKQNDPVVCKYGIFSKADLQFCNVQDNNADKYYCYSSIASVKKDTSICEILSEKDWNFTYKDSCYIGIATAMQNVGFCNTLTEKFADKSSIDLCYIGLALEKEDLAICELINEVQQKENCLKFVKTRQESN